MSPLYITGIGVAALLIFFLIAAFQVAIKAIRGDKQ